jgi:hypothetical protein
MPKDLLVTFTYLMRTVGAAKKKAGKQPVRILNFKKKSQKILAKLKILVFCTKSVSYVKRRKEFTLPAQAAWLDTGRVCQ